MKRVGTLALCLAGGLLWSAGLRADDAALSGNPYGVVVERNIFGLNPPPLVDPNATVVEPPAKIIPNGIMSIFGQLQVLFKVAGKPPAKDANYILMEGQSQDEIEVVKIDEKAGIVSFNNHGIPQDLPLVVTAPTVTPSAPTGGNPGVPGMVPRGGAPGAISPGNNPFMNRFGNRPGRGGGNPAGGGNPGGGNDGAGSGGSDLSPVNSSGLYQPRAMAPVDPAVSAAQLLLNTENLRGQGSPVAPLMPPVPGFSPPADSNQ